MIEEQALTKYQVTSFHLILIHHMKPPRFCFRAATVRRRGLGAQHIGTSHLLSNFVCLTTSSCETILYIVVFKDFEAKQEPLSTKRFLLCVTATSHYTLEFLHEQNTEGLNSAELEKHPPLLLLLLKEEK